MIRITLVLAALISLAACATTQDDQASAPASIEAIQAARMADLLNSTAEATPERIRAAQAELAALEQVLMTAPEPAAPVAAVPPPLAPAPDLSGSRSVMSAVHLASYREYANLVAGWDELQEEAPSLLGDLDVRIAEANLGERGIFLRLKAGPLDSLQAAEVLCAQLEAAGHWCAPADFDGRALQR